ncbi:MAG: cytochrome c biogenesis protein CcsA [Planctomycetota bacterium]
MILRPDSSFIFLSASGLAAVVTTALGFLSAVLHFWGKRPAVAAWLSRGTFATFVGGLVCSLTGIGLRWIEVNHFPVQSMFEALTTTAASVYVMFAILYFVLGLYKTTGMVRGMSDLFLALIMAGEFALLYYTNSQEKGPRTLPPALQSYWMSVHVPALLMAYVTMAIAYVACMLFFTLKFIRQIVVKAAPQTENQAPLSRSMSIAGMLSFLGFVFLLPFAQIVNLAIFVPVAAIGYFLAKTGKLTTLDSWIDGFDKFSHTIFGIGFPFLTAGLMMGAFWAQEAWALYWGWDSKETSALISWLIYVVYLHLRYVAGWKGERGFSVIMGGAISIFITFQLFALLPASQDSMHKYTDGISREGTELSAGQTGDKTGQVAQSK